jgi:thiol:disulfide interchange protein DsbC
MKNINLKKIILLATMAISTASISDSHLESAQIFNDAKNWINTIEESTKFPLTKLNYVKSQGQTFLVSGNGHYAIFGDFKIIDVWNRTVIENAQDLKDSNRVSMGIFKRQAKELMSTITYGRGAIEVFIFFDHQSKYSNLLNKQVAELGDKYKFYFINFPAIPGSAEIAKKLECNTNATAAKSIILNDYSYLENVTNCKGMTEKLRASLFLAKIIGINKVPSIVAPNGKLHEGYVKDLNKFLEVNKK